MLQNCNHLPILNSCQYYNNCLFKPSVHFKMSAKNRFLYFKDFKEL